MLKKAWNTLVGPLPNPGLPGQLEASTKITRIREPDAVKQPPLFEQIAIVLIHPAEAVSKYYFVDLKASIIYLCGVGDLNKNPMTSSSIGRFLMNGKLPLLALCCELA